ncbi:MAG: sulfite exporter TauE/SafE family protein [Verrucomicrobiota bacterium]
MFDLQPWQWALVILGAFLAGVAKTGIAGLGILTVAIYANILPAKESTGIILPMLICADVVAVVAYRRHAVWSHMGRLFPWVAVGIGAGYWAMGRIDGAQVRHVIGVILLGMTGLHCWRKWRKTPVPHAWWVAAATGVLAGFTTMMANAAGPIMVLYWLALGLPKMEFLGTGAWYFLIINLFKVPFSYHLGLITPASLQFNLWMAPAVVAGALLGRVFVQRINQTWFEILALGLTLVAAIRLLW